MILGIGVDILHLPRFQRLFRLRPERLVTRILTKAEQLEFYAIQERSKASLSLDGKDLFIASSKPGLTSSAVSGREPRSITKSTLSPSPSKDRSTQPVQDHHEESFRYLASRWALKEASFKALYPHYTLTWQDVTVVKEHGKPCVKVADGFGVGRTHASVSHDGEYLIGQVLFESS